MSSPTVFEKLIEACKGRNKLRFTMYLNRLYRENALPSDIHGQTVAHYCYRYGYIEGVERMLKYGLDTHQTNSNNSFPIHLACEHNQTDMIKWHLLHNNREEEYQLPDKLSSFLPAMWLVCSGNFALMKEFHARGYIDPDHETFYRKNTIFTLAVQMGQAEIAWYLWQNGLQGRYGFFKERRRKASLIADIIGLVRFPEKTFQFMEKMGLMHLFLNDIKEEDHDGGSVVMCCIKFARVEAFACLVKRGLARPSVEYDMFRELTSDEVGLFVERLEREDKHFYIFLSTFLFGTLAVPRFPDLKKKVCPARKVAMASLSNDVYRLIADFVGIAYGRPLLYLREAAAFIRTML